MTAPAQAACIYCDRDMWLSGLEPCCGRPEHAGRLVCADVRGCLDVVLRRLHDQEQRAECEPEYITVTPSPEMRAAVLAAAGIEDKLAGGTHQDTSPAAVPANRGPYETERDAARGSLWHCLGRGGDMKPANAADLATALSGITLGAYDRVIADWLAGWEPSTVAVVCGWIRRARGDAS